MLAGDFNTILAVQNRINGTSVTLAKIKDCGEFVDNHSLSELKSSGHFFSRHKGGDGTKTASQIDRCLGKVDWMDKRGEVCTEYLNSGIFLIIVQFLSIVLQMIKVEADPLSFLIC